MAATAPNPMSEQTPYASTKNEFELTDKDFDFVVRFIAEHAGISLTQAKRQMVYGRLVRRLRALGLQQFSDYCALLEDPDSGEVENFVNALTTNLTAFFREPHHFEFLAQELLPRLVNERPQRRIRVWSAGCSTGEEPYSLAMVLAENLPASWDIRILATDLDSNVISTASAGVYPLERLGKLEAARMKRWFLQGKGRNTGMVKVRPALRKLITFRQLNLLGSWPMQQAFDVIFCRNVVIYFTKDTQRGLFNRFADQLHPDGHLFVGHSESLFKVCERFRPLGGTIYQRML